MKAYRMVNPGEAPSIAQIVVPEPAQGEVRVRVRACGLNFADLLMVSGDYQETPAIPFTLGMEMAGHIDAVGPDTKAPKAGTPVAAFAGSGGLAEYAVVPADRLVPLPAHMPMVDAAAFIVAYGTSHVALADRARLQSGETLLVLGAAGGVGLTAVEIGRRMGARVIACARGADKLAVAKSAGADVLIDSETQDIRAEVKALGGADVVYDPIGGDQFTAALRATRPEGRIVTIGFASGTVPKIPANILLVKNITVIGFYWGGYLKIRPKVIADSLETLFGWYGDGGLHPHVSHRFPLDAAAEALETLRSRRSTGKVVVTMPDEA